MGKKQKRTVVYMNNYPFDTLGGGEKHLLLLAKAAKEWEFRVCVICLPQSGIERALNELSIETIPLNIMSKNFILTILRISKELRKIGADIFHTHGFFCNVIGRIAGKISGIPAVVSTVHCEPDSTLSYDKSLKAKVIQIIRNFADRFTSQYADMIIAVAERVKEKLVKIGIPSEKIIVIRNGIPIKPVQTLQTKKELGKVVVGTLGRLEPVKGFDYFIEAAALIKNSELGQRVNFVIVGDGSLRKHLEDKVATLGLKDCFKFTGYQEDTISEVGKMDIFVASSLSDTTNLALLEAMAVQKPVVATEVGGIPEAVVDGVTGYLIPPADPQALAEKIIHLVKEPNLRERMGKKGRERVEKNFDSQQMLEKYLRLYSSLVPEN